MTRIAIVLGAGGITGIAWLLGALEVVREETGWDPASADVLCGTSAGAIAAVTLAGGVATDDLLRLAEDPAALRAQTAAAVGDAAVGHAVPLAWPGSVALGVTALAGGTGGPGRRLASLAGFAPRGSRSPDEVRGLVHAADRGGWPTRPQLLLNACDYRTGARVTFGAEDAPAASVTDAAAASAAVPGWYRPVRIDGRDYVDGGLVSFTNADVVAAERPDLVLAFAPFSSVESGGRRDRATFGLLRRATHAQLERELAGLRAQGIATAALEPTAEDLRVMGLNVMERAHARAVVETARATTRGRLGDIAAALAPRRAARRRRLLRAVA